jgi:hypothetical protein
VRKQEIRLSITQVVSASYCEHKAMLDCRIGQKKTPTVAARAAAGEVAHAQFEREGRVLASRGPILPPHSNQTPMPGATTGAQTGRDRRCFIASTVYGQEAPETEVLRAWRDRVLMRTVLGRGFVRLYYVLSPRIAAFVGSRPGLLRRVRACLDALVRRVG